MNIFTLQQAQEFDSAKARARHVVMVFGGPNCAICKRLSPILHAYATQGGDVAVVEIDSERLSELAAHYGIRSLPTLLWFHHGTQRGRKTGYLTLAELREWRAEIEALPFFVNVENAPLPPGPFSHASLFENLVFTSGMGGLDPATGEVVSDDVIEQTRQSIRNTEEILHGAGCTLQNVLKVTLYLTDMADYGRVNAVYEEAFSPGKPARTCVAVSSLPVRERMKIDTIAIRRTA